MTPIFVHLLSSYLSKIFQVSKKTKTNKTKSKKENQEEKAAEKRYYYKSL